MRRISLVAHYIWCVMDCVCWMRGHKLVSFPKGRYCRRCYKVEGVDFGPRSGGLPRQLWDRLREQD